jgi:outer membrane protein OmpA-like peptidoglycan-associated protein
MSTNEEKKDGALGLLLPLLLLAFLAAGVYYLFGTGGSKNSEEHAATATEAKHEATEPEKPAVMEIAKESLKVKLPGGTELDAYKGGIEDRLVAFLNTDYKKLGADSLKNTWFDFDNLNFHTASADITAESQHQINNIAAILKAFPTAKLKIGGYTDKVGDLAVNKKLSGDRANSVKAALDKAGVGAQITDAEGYGSAFAKHPADAPESERVTDRRVSVSVRL